MGRHGAMKPAGSVRSRRWVAMLEAKETSGIMRRIIARRAAIMVAPAYHSMIPPRYLRHVTHQRVSARGQVDLLSLLCRMSLIAGRSAVTVEFRD